MNHEDRSKPERFKLQPDPAWDWNEVDGDGVLVVELSWTPDAMAARNEDIVVSPALADALVAAKVTGFTTGAARGVYSEQAFGVDEGEEPPALLRLIPGDDPAADIAYVKGDGLTVSRRALDLLRAHCQNLQIDTGKPVIPTLEQWAAEREGRTP